MKDSLFVFQNDIIDSNSVTEHASGTNVDFFAVPTSNLTSISALEGKIVLYFKSSNTFENSKADQAKVTLNTAVGSESRAAIATWALTLEEGKIYIFDDIRSSYPDNYATTISGIDSIVRPTAERFDDGGISNVVEDTTPQLGGDLDAQSNNITNLGSLNGTAASKIISRSLTIACSDETTALTTGAAKATFRMPEAATITGVKASVTTAPVGSVLTVDINESGSTILSTKLTVDAGEKTSTTAATAAVISDTSIANDAEITIDIDAVGSSTAGAGLKVTIYYNPA